MYFDPLLCDSTHFDEPWVVCTLDREEIIRSIF